MSDHHYALPIEYDGTNYAGFQRQTKEHSIQGELERALSILIRDKVSILFGGRTDTGVHANGQVISFKADHAISNQEKFLTSFNAILPFDINALELAKVPLQFHPQFSCYAREYLYFIWNNETPSIFWRNYSVWIKKDLNINLIKENLSLIQGEHDFSSFVKMKSLPENPIRKIYKADLVKKGNLIIFRICGNGFFHHMIRNIIGTIIEIEKNQSAKIKTPTIDDILRKRDRRKAGAMSPAKGLFLHRLYYPHKYGLAFSKKKSFSIIDQLSIDFL